LKHADNGMMTRLDVSWNLRNPGVRYGDAERAGISG
jgi:hypothetical protein